MNLTKDDIGSALKLTNGRMAPLPGYVQAAVLMLFSRRDSETLLTYIRRTLGVDIHSGQIAFPGGKVDPRDASSRATATRETFEEIGIPRDGYDYLGAIGYFSTMTSRFDAMAHVGWCPQPLSYTRSEVEVAEVIEIPVAHLYAQLSPFAGKEEARESPEPTFRYNRPNAPEVIIWGLTARMTHYFLAALQRSLR